MKKSLALVALTPLSAFAAIPSSVSTAIESAGTDAAAVAALVFVAIVGIFAVKLMRKGL